MAGWIRNLLDLCVFTMIKPGFVAGAGDGCIEFLHHDWRIDGIFRKYNANPGLYPLVN